MGAILVETTTPCDNSGIHIPLNILRTFTMGHKTSLNKREMIQVYKITPDHNGINLEINNRRVPRKSPNYLEAI